MESSLLAFPREGHARLPRRLGHAARARRPAGPRQRRQACRHVGVQRASRRGASRRRPRRAAASAGREQRGRVSPVGVAQLSAASIRSTGSPPGTLLEHAEQDSSRALR